jgi:hypothetical protein
VMGEILLVAKSAKSESISRDRIPGHQICSLEPSEPSADIPP